MRYLFLECCQYDLVWYPQCCWHSWFYCDSCCKEIRAYGGVTHNAMVCAIHQGAPHSPPLSNRASADRKQLRQEITEHEQASSNATGDAKQNRVGGCGMQLADLCHCSKAFKINNWIDNSDNHNCCCHPVRDEIKKKFRKNDECANLYGADING